jgi:hypothetical protein
MILHSKRARKSHETVSFITGFRCSSRGRGWRWPPTPTTTERPTNSTSVIAFIIIPSKKSCCKKHAMKGNSIVLYLILVLIYDKLDLFVCRIPPGPSSLPGLQDWNQVLRVAQWAAAILHMAPHVHSKFCVRCFKQIWKVGKVGKVGREGKVGKVGKVGKIDREGFIMPTWNQLWLPFHCGILAISWQYFLSMLAPYLAWRKLIIYMNLNFCIKIKLFPNFHNKIVHLIFTIFVRLL